MLSWHVQGEKVEFLCPRCGHTWSTHWVCEPDTGAQYLADEEGAGACAKCGYSKGPMQLHHTIADAAAELFNWHTGTTEGYYLAPLRGMLVLFVVKPPRRSRDSRLKYLLTVMRRPADYKKWVCRRKLVKAVELAWMDEPWPRD